MIHNYESSALCTGKHCINAGFFCTGRKPRTCFFGKARQLQSLKFYQFQPPRTSHCSIRLSFILGSETDNYRGKTFVQQEIQKYPNFQHPVPAKCSTQTQINRIHCCICIIFSCRQCRRVALASSFLSPGSLVHLRKTQLQ